MSNPELIQQIITKNLDSGLPFVLPAPMINIFETEALGGARLAIKGSTFHFTMGMNTPSPVDKVINMYGGMVCVKNLGESFEDAIGGPFTILPLEHREYAVGTTIAFIDSLGIDVCLGISDVNANGFMSILLADDEKAKDFRTIVCKHMEPQKMMPDGLSSLNVIAIKLTKGVLFIRENGNSTMDIVVANEGLATEIHTNLPYMSDLNIIMLIMSLLARLSPVRLICS